MSNIIVENDPPHFSLTGMEVLKAELAATREMYWSLLKMVADGVAMQPLPTMHVTLDATVERDAARYRWLRAQHWDSGPLAVVRNPKDAVKLGYEAPSGDRLDAAIDKLMGVQR